MKRAIFLTTIFLTTTALHPAFSMEGHSPAVPVGKPINNNFEKIKTLVFNVIGDSLSVRFEQDLEEIKEKVKGAATSLNRDQKTQLRTIIQNQYGKALLNTGINLDLEGTNKKAFQAFLEETLPINPLKENSKGNDFKTVKDIIFKIIGDSITVSFPNDLNKATAQVKGLAISLDRSQKIDLYNLIQAQYGKALLNTAINLDLEEESSRALQAFMEEALPINALKEKEKEEKEEEIKKLDSSENGPKHNDLADSIKNPEDVDTEYDTFIHNFAPKIATYPVPIPIENPKEHLQGKYTFNSQNPTFPEGKYAWPNPLTNFWFMQSAPEFNEVNKRGQGWKIHITAMPHSATKIAQLVLPEITQNQLPGQQSSFVSYKIIRSIPLMRTFWALRNVTGQETQPGKFLVLYPDSWVHSYHLVKKIDEILNNSLRKGLLKKSDFLPLIGDAQVGTSGGVYVRYGRYTQGKVKRLTPLDETMPSEVAGLPMFDEDDRFYPWPDFMNKKNEYWSSHESPFHELPISWTSFVNPKHKINSWQKRPTSWQEIAEGEEVEELEKSKDKSEEMEAAAREQQEEADRLLAMKLQTEEETFLKDHEEQVRLDEEFARRLQEEELG